MKKKLTFYTLMLWFLLIGCKSTQQNDSITVAPEEQAYFESEDSEAVEISDEESEYEIMIIEPGFYAWLNSIARPEGFYSKSFLETRNQLMVINWNQRVQQPFQFNPQLYQFEINYNSGVDYGYEVNYKLYNYFIFFQRKYNQRLGPFLPRI